MDNKDGGKYPVNDATGNIAPSESVDTAKAEGKKSTHPEDKANSSQSPAESVRKITWLEYILAATNIALVIVGAWALIVYNGQLKVMQHTLDEMKRGGQGTTDQPNTLIGNMNWLARTMDGSLQQTREALGLTRDNFRRDERPYLWYTNKAEQPWYRQESSQVAWNWHITNFGKSPAYHIYFHYRITLGEGTPIPGFDVSPPGDGAPMAPGQDTFQTAGSNTAISKADFERILADPRAPMTLHATVDYTDSFGTRYQTVICVLHLPSGAVKYCDTGNSIK